MQTALDKKYGQGKYHVADTTLGEFDGLRKAEEGNPVGVCAGPKAAIAASKIDSPIISMSTQWRGKAGNPYPYSGDKTELLDIGSEMDPCKTCALEENESIYVNKANEGVK
ncbi:hypothetical protein [Celerinatantimonas sp. MCCC 1A17872]|uniref:hypothetical protein n=1 Tax=Celerinatantimonas sp. MCCC 1A17872 TaxID=3177514 RepID=UPI0038C5019B